MSGGRGGGVSVKRKHKASHADLLCWDAIKRNDPSDLHTAIEMGANLKEMDEDHLTPIQQASLRGYSKMASIILDAGSSGPNPTDHNRHHEGATSVHIAAACGHAHIVKLLADRGAQVGAKDDMRRTPTHAALHAHFPARYGFRRRPVAMGVQYCTPRA